MSWYGTHPKLPKTLTRVGGACRLCIYRVRAFPSYTRKWKWWGEDKACTKCGLTIAEVEKLILKKSN